METIDKIIGIEWEMFDKVKNVSGRASCQDDFVTFDTMRRSQAEAWDDELRASYLADLEEARNQGRNLLTEKYAYMMAYTAPEEFKKMEKLLPVLTEEKKRRIRRIADENLKQYTELAKVYPLVTGNGRPEYAKEESDGEVSIETYMLGELATYSMATLEDYERYMEVLGRAGKSIPRATLENTMKKYGFNSLEDAEQALRKKNYFAY